MDCGAVSCHSLMQRALLLSDEVQENRAQSNSETWENICTWRLSSPQDFFKYAPARRKSNRGCSHTKRSRTTTHYCNRPWTRKWDILMSNDKGISIVLKRGRVCNGLCLQCRACWAEREREAVGRLSLWAVSLPPICWWHVSSNPNPVFLPGFTSVVVFFVVVVVEQPTHTAGINPSSGQGRGEISLHWFWQHNDFVQLYFIFCKGYTNETI